MSLHRLLRRPPADRGSVSVEVAILAPAFIALVALAAVTGRVAIAFEAVEVAAHDAARAASISRDADDARTAAADAVQDQLDWQGLACTAPPVLGFDGTVGGAPSTFDGAFNSPVGQDATVSVTVTCTLSFADLQMGILPEMPLNKTVSATFVSPLDRYRSRSA